MQIHNIHAAKTHFSQLVDAAAGGETIIIAKAGVPVAKLVPITPQAPRDARGCDIQRRCFGRSGC
ncbi:type II toxin-antitoxin system prevent-host-death family antitoxin [uncultured Pseudomonas sp.]|uniref:type II toxin-antitoxin system Phd/YefM family antitoxin n=1 Tax=uncultured Pseudomonas sp. TaxID=114707 RepID=UPI0027DACD8F|nr:type II toxin-antitoxin system prevent-host-death family antitoxin [uncultured Pseudomonas sp.]